MSDFLQRLIARNTDSVAPVRPRSPALFEPPASLGPLSVEPPSAAGTDTGIAVSPPAPATSPKVIPLASPEPSPAAQPLPSPLMARDIVTHHVPERVPPVATPLASDAMPPTVSIEAAPPAQPPLPSPLPTQLRQPSPEPRREDPWLPVNRETHREVAERTAEKEPLLPPPAPVMQQTIIGSKQRDVIERKEPAAPAPSLSSIVRQMVLQPVVHEVVPEPTPQPVSVPLLAAPNHERPESRAQAALRMAHPEAVLKPRRGQQRLETSPPALKPHTESLPAVLETPTPEIHVTIGRVEVRATTPTDSAPSKPRPRPVVMSLDDYLAQRASGSG